MKIRDIEQYVRALCGDYDLSKVGTDREKFLVAMHGVDTQVDAVITSAASFASNSEEQLFYEFVQNAYDAGADSLFFFADEDYLIVVNNGTPFLTDLDYLEQENPREGQLYNFLAKGKSRKLNDDSKLGKYGQGSKLLYTLLTEKSISDNDTLLLEAIKEMRKGPTLISWHNRAQLSELLLNNDSWELAEADDVENNVLIAKIVMSYFPVAPGVSDSLFSKRETHKAINAFNRLVNPDRYKSFLNQGTALIIPLGQGKYDLITDKDNLDKVKTRLGGFASIVGDQYRDRTTNLDHIYVMGEEVEQFPVKSVFVHYWEKTQEFKYQFAFNEEFANKNYVNFFKGLPVLQTRFRLGFIIDSQNFELDNSRQRINDTDKTEEQLILAYKHLIPELYKIKDSDHDLFVYIYKALAASHIPSLPDDARYVRDSFVSQFRKFFEEVVLTRDNEFKSLGEVVANPENVYVPLNAVGIKKFWVDPDILPHLRNRQRMNIAELSFVDLLTQANKGKLTEWILSLSDDEYRAFHECCLKYKTDDRLEHVKLYRSNKGKLYSYYDLTSDTTILYNTNDTNIPFIEMEHIKEKVDISAYYFSAIAFEKVKKNISTFRGSNAKKDVAAQLLCFAHDNRTDLANRIKNEICLLSNRQEEYLPFSDLFEERPDDSILFDDFLIKGYIPAALKKRGWFINPKKQPYTAWKWVRGNMDAIAKVKNWGPDTSVYIDDLIALYKKAKASMPLGSIDYLTISGFYLNSQGIPTTEKFYCMENQKKLTANQYRLLCDTCSDYSFAPSEYSDILTSDPFSLERKSANEIIDSYLGKTLSYDIVTALFVLNPLLIEKYKIDQIERSYRLDRLNQGRNYFDSKLDTSLISLLKKGGLYQVPTAIQLLSSGPKDNFYLTRNSVLMRFAINNCSPAIDLFPIIKSCNQAIQLEFLDKLGSMEIKTKLDDKDVYWDIINYAMGNTTLSSKVFSMVTHKGQPLPNEIAQRYFKLQDNSEHTYDVYKLDAKIKQENEKIDSFLSCLPSESASIAFRSKYYANKEHESNPGLVYYGLKDKPLSIYQLRYCLDFCFTFKQNYASLELADSESLYEALKMIKKYKFKGFDDYFNIEEFDPDVQVFAPRSILDTDEQLPTDLYRWLDDDAENVSYFKSLLTASEPLIAVRESILNQQEHLGSYSDFHDDSKEDMAERTLNWITKRQTKCFYNTPLYTTLTRIIANVSYDADDFPMLKYTGGCKMPDSASESIKPEFLFCYYDDCHPSALMRSGWSRVFLEKLASSRKLQTYVRDNNVYVYSSNKEISKRRIDKAAFWEIASKVDRTDYKEWDHPTYLKWKATKESKGIVIKLADQQVNVNLTIESDGRSVFKEASGNQDYGYIKDSLVVVKYSPRTGNTVLKTLAQYAPNIDFFSQPFITLQSMYIDELEKVTEAVEGISQEDLNLIAKNKDKIKKLLQEEVEEEKEPKINQVIGYIGELLYESFLKKRGFKYEFAADNGVGEYDFINKTSNLLIDVKTTIAALNSGSAPFYLHRSQIQFLQDYEDDNYHVVRLSLKDLELDKEYSNLKSKHDCNQDPRANAALKKACKELAEKYWSSHSARDFESKIAEYTIKKVEDGK